MGLVSLALQVQLYALGPFFAYPHKPFVAAIFADGYGTAYRHFRRDHSRPANLALHVVCLLLQLAANFALLQCLDVYFLGSPEYGSGKMLEARLQPYLAPVFSALNYAPLEALVAQWRLLSLSGVTCVVWVGYLLLSQAARQAPLVATAIACSLIVFFHSVSDRVAAPTLKPGAMAQASAFKVLPGENFAGYPLTTSDPLAALLQSPIALESCALGLYLVVLLAYAPTMRKGNIGAPAVKVVAIALLLFAAYAVGWPYAAHRWGLAYAEESSTTIVPATFCLMLLFSALRVPETPAIAGTLLVRAAFVATGAPPLFFYSLAFLAPIMQGIAHKLSGQEATLVNLNDDVADGARSGFVSAKISFELAHVTYFPTLAVHSVYQTLFGNRGKAKAA